tara:strand:- start:793 stop:1275 length:483 start_codon:yes stop_codon:yes gene_type:complete
MLKSRKIKYRNFAILFLFLNFIFIPKGYAIQNLVGFNDNKIVFIISLSVGLITNSILCFSEESERKKLIKSKNFFSILYKDFWFDEFIILKFASILYFLSVSIYYGFLIYFAYLLIYQNQIIYLFYILISPLYLIIIRTILESTIALIKIAQNTSKNDNE